MTKTRSGRRLAIMATAAVASLAAVAPAQADVAGTPADCDARVERLEAQFYEMADRRSYEAASEWWQHRWQAHFQSRILH